MAHWIIEDEWFDGVAYQCSNCREIWNDSYHREAGGKICPNCGAQMDEDAVEYTSDAEKALNRVRKTVDRLRESMTNVNAKMPLFIGSFDNLNAYSNYISNRYENILKLEEVSGKSMDELIVLFAAGWELRPPRNGDATFSEISSMGCEE